ncbi:XrtA-associated tyrosine autokinase [Alteromonas mediterranea]|uniref:non-specific protein-tyrosine kinase n=1 Tax=Alteromonas mediterranea TaxID=314275 RepID=A0AAC8XL09_9ALTE|nr:XrtA-associated tyrosine autokinase [Alteromonas mediterranea]AFV86330.1 putative exopolysaccharide biosynthesis protein [Alteromonas mediterranea DE1]AGP98342.1 exopolysaccharide biosynthesis protein [Alteromonas mediterranea UM7]AGQ02597.1 exopolysaccharide biosynthesis protein [Alteromonas mediterranea UM4b]AMJ79325.1 exopolysaccharide biosynthesis protein [Alteromonas mediterranea]AMJ83469.1 exopolysaccharide biosynthesis protein [Alteromonas mediterranea]
MKNTIEKALQKQKEAKAAKQNDIAEGTLEDTQVSSQSEESEVSIEIPTSSNIPADKIVVDEKEFINKKSPFDEFTINFERLDKNGHISLNGERKQINEEYREIKRKLLANAFGSLAKTLHNPNIIMVTSSRPSEGKTFTATNLAMSIASEQDKTVLLVDADVLKPNVLNTLGLERRKGLMEYLTGDVEDISDVLYPTNIDKLKIIPAGKSHHLSTELLASQKMHETVDEFANRYPDRIVIFDTPPLIGINESAILANFAGQAVVVVEEGKAKIGDIKMSVERLNPDMAIGFVVNKSVHNDTDGSGYYGYYYSERSE